MSCRRRLSVGAKRRTRFLIEGVADEGVLGASLAAESAAIVDYVHDSVKMMETGKGGTA